MTADIPKHNPRITRSIADQDRQRRYLMARVEPMLSEAFERASESNIAWNNNDWLIFVDWARWDLARHILFNPNLPEDKRGTNHPFYKYFELFDRGIMSGTTEDPVAIAFVWCLLEATRTTAEGGLRHFAVDFNYQPPAPPVLALPAPEVKDGLP